MAHGFLFGEHFRVKKRKNEFRPVSFSQVCMRMLLVSVGLVMFSRRPSLELTAKGILRGHAID